MEKKSLCFWLMFLAFSSLAQDKLNSHLDLVRGEYSGENAFETVAFVEKYWRIAGNTGFNESIFKVEEILKSAGYVKEPSPESRLTYRIESRNMNRLTWEPIDATLSIAGENTPLLEFESNRNMLAVNSWSTEGPVTGEVIDVSGFDFDALKKMDISGKVLFAEGNLRRHAGELKKLGVLGTLDYGIPGYLNPEQNRNSIQFRGIRQDTSAKPWAIILSTEARDRIKQALADGDLNVTVDIQTRLYPSEELTIIADVKGRSLPDERFVYSAHVQEPGANDNASGVGAQAEMASVLAKLMSSGKFDPDRTITFVFGDEIVSTRRYITEDEDRAEGIKWGMSLDMVGENTEVTGGSFLIEKLPDPAAVYLRGEDQHTEWGGRPLDPSEIVNHYYNDLTFETFRRQGEFADWAVNVNPFEGGSDHVPFLDAEIPGVLLWHFTDQFYHTDGDRIDKVSAKTLENVGTGALAIAMFLSENQIENVKNTLSIVEEAARRRLMVEQQLSIDALSNGSELNAEKEILQTWITYYTSLCSTVVDINDSKATEALADETRVRILTFGTGMLKTLR